MFIFPRNMSSRYQTILFLFYSLFFMDKVCSNIINFPYGLSAQDDVFDRIDLKEIDMEFSYDYTGYIMSHIYIKNDGYLQNKIPYELTDKESMLSSTGSPIFLAQIDPNIGNIYYRIVKEEKTKSSIEKLVKDCFSQMSDYSSTFNFIVTWDQVVESSSTISSINNTFQLVFSSNSTHTFFLYNYLDLNWGNDKNGAGISTYKKEFYLDDAFTNNVKNLQTSSNIGVPGSFFIGVNNQTHFLPDSVLTSTISQK